MAKNCSRKRNIEKKSHPIAITDIQIEVSLALWTRFCPKIFI